jgi:hypothetical protein
MENIFIFTEQNQIKIKAFHLRGIDNSTVDALSRLSRAGDYSIKKEILDNTMKQLKVELTIDAFSNRKNKRTKRFITINNDKLAEGRDGLQYPWTGETVLAHPPIPLIGRVLQKILKEKTTVVLIAPWWPAQYWWPTLMEMKEIALILGRSEEVLEMGNRMKKRGLKLPPG